jgi:hypothetical protein
MDNNDTRPFQQGKAPTQEQLAAFERLTKMLKGGGEYVPIMKTLKSLGVTHKIQDVVIDGSNSPTECICIPLSDLRDAEWNHINGTSEVATND